jgi:hypothetical protein
MEATWKSTNGCSMDGPLVNVEPFSSGEQDPFLANLAAELTDVAYRVALRHGAVGKWFELELNLWEALTEAIDKLLLTSDEDRSRMQEGSSIFP